MINFTKIPNGIWEKRKELLEKAKRNDLSFSEFSMLDMHKETHNLLNPKGGLSNEGIATLNAIDMYLESV